MSFVGRRGWVSSMALVLSNVSKSFVTADGDGVTQALSPIDLTVGRGEFVSVVGPSGCGKSTLLRIIAGLTRPTTGEASLDGRPIEGAGPERGVAFQKPTLFPWLTVEQNVAFGPKTTGRLDEERIQALLKTAGLLEAKDLYPHQLSGGMAQRAALVRTMVMEPEVFLLDEPLGALDAFTRMTMQDEILKMWRRLGSTMLMVTHDVDEAIYMGGTVLVMAPRPGRVLERIEIDLPYPRDRTSRRFFELRSHVLDTLHYGSSADVA